MAATLVVGLALIWTADGATSWGRVMTAFDFSGSLEVYPTITHLGGGIDIHPETGRIAAGGFTNGTLIAAPFGFSANQGDLDAVLAVFDDDSNSAGFRQFGTVEQDVIADLKWALNYTTNLTSEDIIFAAGVTQISGDEKTAVLWILTHTGNLLSEIAVYPGPSSGKSVAVKLDGTPVVGGEQFAAIGQNGFVSIIDLDSEQNDTIQIGAFNGRDTLKSIDVFEPDDRCFIAVGGGTQGVIAGHVGTARTRNCNDGSLCNSNDIDAFLTLIDCDNNNILFNRQFGTENDHANPNVGDLDIIQGVKFDKTSATIVAAGYVHGTLPGATQINQFLDTDVTNSFVVKTSINGDILWTVVFGASNWNTFLYDVAVDQTNSSIVVTGATNGWMGGTVTDSDCTGYDTFCSLNRTETFVARIASNGTLLHMHQFGTLHPGEGQAEAFAVAVDNSGDGAVAVSGILQDGGTLFQNPTYGYNGNGFVHRFDNTDTRAPSSSPTPEPTAFPTRAPLTSDPTRSPVTPRPSFAPNTFAPTGVPSAAPTAPTVSPSTPSPTYVPPTSAPAVSTTTTPNAPAVNPNNNNSSSDNLLDIILIIVVSIVGIAIVSTLVATRRSKRLTRGPADFAATGPIFDIENPTFTRNAQQQPKRELTAAAEIAAPIQIPVHASGHVVPVVTPDSGYSNFLSRGLQGPQGVEQAATSSSAVQANSYDISATSYDTVQDKAVESIPEYLTPIAGDGTVPDYLAPVAGDTPAEYAEGDEGEGERRHPTVYAEANGPDGEYATVDYSQMGSLKNGSGV